MILCFIFNLIKNKLIEIARYKLPRGENVTDNNLTNKEISDKIFLKVILI